MQKPSPVELLEDPAELARYRGWREEVYRDLLALQQGRLSSREFDAKHLSLRAVLVLDLTGFTINSVLGGNLMSFLRILDAQKVCLPVLREKASFIHTFADDMVALYDAPGPALDAALEIHRCIRSFAEAHANPDRCAEACIGVGFGPVYSIGPNHAMGDEMNRTSKLGEDTARGGETLVTEGAYEVLRSRGDVSFDRVTRDDLIFPYYRVSDA